MVDDANPPVDNTDKGKETPPAGGDVGQGTKSSEALSQMPEKFKGKSVEDVVKAYDELEKKLGEQSKSVEETNKIRGQMDTLLKAIWADPDLYRKVEEGVAKFQSGGVLPDDRNKNPNGKKSDGETQADPKQVDPLIKELKVSEENRVLNEFFTKYGYNSLAEQERKDNYGKLSLALAELVDPGGSRPIGEILSSIPTSKLSRFLENAHFIANRDMVVKQAQDSALISKRENDSASIGSFSPSSRQDNENVTLSTREREIAQKLGIDEDKYAKRKLQIQKEEKRFG